MTRQDPAADIRASVNGLMAAGNEVAHRNRIAAVWTPVSVLMNAITAAGAWPY
jgi:hypothetical protein